MEIQWKEKIGPFPRWQSKTQSVKSGINQQSILMTKKFFSKSDICGLSSLCWVLAESWHLLSHQNVFQLFLPLRLWNQGIPATLKPICQLRLSRGMHLHFFPLAPNPTWPQLKPAKPLREPFPTPDITQPEKVDCTLSFLAFPPA